MASLTLTGLSDDLKARLQERADRTGRTLNQQATPVLKRTVAGEPMRFERATGRFRKSMVLPRVQDGGWDRLRSE